MSFIDLILGQKTILLTIGIALFILMAATLLLLAPRIRGFFANQRQRAIARQEAAMLGERAAPDPVPVPIAVQPGGAASTPTVSAGSSPQKVAVAAKPAQVAAADAAQTTTASTEQKPEVSSAMQDILSSVFADSEASERYQILLNGTEDVSATDLLALSKRVADQLRLQYPALVNK